jgi:hypothetical protein
MSNDYRLDEANDDFVEACADEIATRAAKLVASRDMDRKDAIKAATEEMRQERAADDDVTGVLGTMIDATKPSKEIPQAQINAIKAELMDSARDAAESL